MIAFPTRLAALTMALASVLACASSDGPRGASALESDAGAIGDSGGPDLVDGAGDAATRTCARVLPSNASACDRCRAERCCVTTTAALEKPEVWSKSAAKICSESACAAECGNTAPACGGIVPSPASCADATRKACCSEMASCAKSDDCVAIVYLCIDGEGLAPGTPAFDRCAAKRAAGKALFEAADACFQTVVCP